MRVNPRRLLDLGFLVWSLAWVALAVQVASEVRGLRDLSVTVKKTGAAVRASGEALERFDGLPLVGKELREPAERIKRAGQSAVQSGESSRESVRDLSILLAIAIGLLPSVAALGLFLQLRASPRLSRRRVRPPYRRVTRS
ncbi:MAG: hypothetical protein ICV69_16450 [Thermoleophilaceae bacterium]|nr:hypothetical protein [Thermoleophilaceae bacterium]